MKTLITIFVCLYLSLTNAWAQSAGDYRYSIRGHILDENRQGIAKQEVRIYKGKLMLEMVNTDLEGYYSVQLQLHNAEKEQKLRLRTGGNEIEIPVTVNPDDANISRLYEANFVDGKFIEGRLNDYLIPPWIYPVLALAGIIYLAIKLEKRRKKKIQIKKDKLSGRSSKNNHATKKKRRRKH